MNTRHSRRISRSAAKSLLDGHAPPDLESLARVLAAAAAPARDSELTGEQLAVAAFEASHLNPVTTSHREHTSMLAKLLTAKVLVASAATALATGGVALAATTGAIPGTGSAPTTTTASQPATKPTFLITPGASAHPQPVTAPTAQPGQVISTPPKAPAPSTSTSSSSASTGQSLPQTAAGLCQALIGDVASASGGTLSQSGEEQALSSASLPAELNNQEFASLVSTAQSASAVGDYCALLLGLPQLPDPSELAQLPSSVLSQLLTALPTSTLAQVLTSLPSSTLSQVLTALPTSALSTILTELPTSVVSQLLQELPVSALSQLPASVLAQLPSSVLSLLPISVPSL